MDGLVAACGGDSEAARGASGGSGATHARRPGAAPGGCARGRHLATACASAPSHSALETSSPGGKSTPPPGGKSTSTKPTAALVWPSQRRMYGKRMTAASTTLRYDSCRGLLDPSFGGENSGIRLGRVYLLIAEASIGLWVGVGIAGTEGSGGGTVKSTGRSDAKPWIQRSGDQIAAR
eukprot:8367043-Pyramimonas_sp.AAC.1